MKKTIPFIAILLISTTAMLSFTPSEKNPSPLPGRPVRVVSFSFPPDKQEFSKVIALVDREAAKGTDIVILPETWRGAANPETLEGETITALSKLARKHQTYILSPIYRRDGEKLLNSAVLIDRQGKVSFIYDKAYPYWEEFKLNAGEVSPGINSTMVTDTDFGRIGVSICFDANFPGVWQALRDQGAELVIWPSAYSAGTQLQAYALLHHYYIVTSTYTKDCQVYDITGQRIVDDKNDQLNITHVTLDLDRSLFHENYNISKRDQLLKTHGNEVEQEQFLNREQWFVLKAKKPGISARALSKQFGMEELIDYKSRSLKAIDKMRGDHFARP